MQTADRPVSTVEEDCLTGDLASLACHAAIELDNLILGRNRGMSSLARLAGVLGDSFQDVCETGSTTSWLNPATAVVVSHALRDSKWKESLTRLDEIIRETGQIVDYMRRVSGNPEQHRQDEAVDPLRDFCLALSKWALASERSLNQRRPEHPYRR